MLRVLMAVEYRSYKTAQPRVIYYIILYVYYNILSNNIRHKPNHNTVSKVTDTPLAVIFLKRAQHSFSLSDLSIGWPSSTSQRTSICAISLSRGVSPSSPPSPPRLEITTSFTTSPSSSSSSLKLNDYLVFKYH